MLDILDNGIVTKDGQVRYLWFELDYNGRRFFRAVALAELTALPITAREDYDLLDKQAAAVRGLYDAKVDFLYLALGIFHPRHIGVVQMYGAAGEGQDAQSAGAEAEARLASVQAILANYPQSQTRPPKREWVAWYVDFVTNQDTRLLAILGYPDPRKTRRGISRDGELPNPTGDDMATEQNEILFRGLTKVREDFVFQVASHRISRERLTRDLMQVARLASIVASRQRGNLGMGFSMSLPIMAAVSQGVSAGKGAGHTDGRGVTDGAQHSWGRGHADQVSHTDSVSDTVGGSRSVSVTRGTGENWQQSVTKTHTETNMAGQTHSETVGGGANVQLDVSAIVAGAKGGFHAERSATDGWNVSHAVSDGTAMTQGHGTSQQTAVTITNTASRSHTEGSANTRGATDSVQEGWGQTHQEARTWSDVRNLTAGQMAGFSMSTGLMPGVNISRSWQAEDDVAIRTTEVLRQLEGIVNQASHEGGFMTTALILTASERGARAAQALTPQAYHGPKIPTPVLTVAPDPQDAEALRNHAVALMPWIAPEESKQDPFAGSLWTKYATMLPPERVAAFTTPGIFEEGTLVAAVPPLPTGLSFYPDMDGEVVLGHQFSPETGDLTTAPVKLSKSRFFHTLFVGDTGWGKSVAAERMVYEVTKHWKVRSVVLDFGAGWRKLLNAPGMAGHVTVYQLWPEAANPLRWNPLQIGKGIPPSIQLDAFTDIFTGVQKLGERRQKKVLRKALRAVYLQTGVLVNDREVRQDPKWGKVQPDEADLVGFPPGTPLGDVPQLTRNLIAWHRSRRSDLSELYAYLERELQEVAYQRRSDFLVNIYEGILERLRHLVEGNAAEMFGAGSDTLDVGDLAAPWGIAVVEGGMFASEELKAFILAWLGWHLYMDMAWYRATQGKAKNMLFLVFEEANKILGGIAGPPDEEATHIRIFSDFAVDSRKHGVRMAFCTQAPHLLGDAIISSCNNWVVGFIKNPKDKELALEAFARSSKGFRDETWRNFLSYQRIGQVMGRFPYSMDRLDQAPIVFQPLILDVPEPSDAEIAAAMNRTFGGNA
ncbi:MAG TPA: ATP-binding protein [Chloroflexi bacterium]|nr:ATP-binding protein [Chloroflexota bacterium]